MLSKRHQRVTVSRQEMSRPVVNKSENARCCRVWVNVAKSYGFNRHNGEVKTINEAQVHEKRIYKSSQRDPAQEDYDDDHERTL